MRLRVDGIAAVAHELGPGNLGKRRRVSASDILSIRVPFRTVRGGGRKLILVPEGAQPAHRPHAEPEVDATLLRAIVRAWRWRRAIEDGRSASITERGGLTDSFVTRVIALTTLAPDFLQTVLDGSQPPAFTLQKVIGTVSSSWTQQHLSFDFEGIRSTGQLLPLRKSPASSSR